jgi:multiple sugar transport system ATP-binding protein
MATISIQGLRKSYAELEVLRAIDLDVQAGEFLVLVGPSGCGKTTLLRLIAGLEAASAGEIRIDGERVNELAPKDRDLAMVFQSYALYPHMSVRDNMSFSLKLRGMPAAQIEAAVRAASETLGIQDLLERKPRALSGGQKQRVAMGRAMVRSPKAFLFDEPLSNLDARLREQMRYEIRKLQRQLGTTSIYVTHDQIEAMTMADRIVAMNEGVVQQVGTPNELYDDPANIFVGGFIGSPAMNYLEATLADAHNDDMIEVMLGTTLLARVPRPAGLRGARSAGAQRATLGLRPERIALGAPGEGIAAQIELLEPTGLGVVLHLALAGQRLKVFTAGRTQARVNDRVGLRVAAADILLFDASSGLRLR